MRVFKFVSFGILSLALFSSAFAQTEKKEEIELNKESESCEPTELIAAKVTEMKTLDVEGISWIREPFVFVARDAKTFEILKKSVENLPETAKIDFTKSAVIAAFAGPKGGLGNSVAITKSAGNYSINFIPPPKKKLITANLQYPRKIMLVPVEEEKTLNLTIAKDFKSSVKSYKISSSEFKYSGGFAFREKKFSADGTIDVLQVGNLVTISFNLSGKGSGNKMKLTETASGILKDGKIEILRLDVGNFAENPKPPVKVSGTLTENKLSLNFESLPTNIADGFSMNGKIEAVTN